MLTKIVLVAARIGLKLTKSDENKLITNANMASVVDNCSRKTFTFVRSDRIYTFSIDAGLWPQLFTFIDVLTDLSDTVQPRSTGANTLQKPYKENH